MLESDQLLFFDKIIAVKIKVITYQDEIKLEIDRYIWIRTFSNSDVICDLSGTVLGKPTRLCPY